MLRNRMLALALVACCGVTALAAESVGVSGSSTKYETPVEKKVGTKAVKLNLTGTALRKKFVFSVYSIGSYVDAAAAVKSAQDLAEKDVAKQLHLVMERDVTGKDMAAAFREAIVLNYKESDFEGELKALTEFMQKMDVKKGDEVFLTHIPGVGLSAEVVGKTEIRIENPAFSKAVWNIYLGERNIGDAIKKGLVSRL